MKNSVDLDLIGITAAMIRERHLQQHMEAQDLQIAQVDGNGREFHLTPATCRAWHAMKSAALADGIDLLMISAFRGVRRQAEIILAKLDAGDSIAQILEVCAPPGYSEHHTGRAIDIACAQQPELEISFENTAAFLWLASNAKRFGFLMSYPRDNLAGFQYEPWHWCFQVA